MVESTLDQIIFRAFSFATGIALFFYTSNKEIIDACPNSNIWYLALLHSISIEAYWVLIPFDIHEILDECNREKLTKSVPYIVVVAPYFIIAVVITLLTSICVMSVITVCCLTCLEELPEPRRHAVPTITV